MINIFWFRRDLRTDDNKGFYEALIAGEEVLPIFIFDKNILDKLPKDDARVTFISQLVDKIQDGLKKHKKKLGVFYGKPEEILSKLIKDHEVKAVYFNHDYEPYARERDKIIYKLLTKNNIEVKNYKDQVIFEKSEVVKDDGTPYVVYTPYSKKWKELFNKSGVEHFPSENKLDAVTAHSYPFLSLEDIGFTKSNIEVENFKLTESLITDYADNRNFPATNGTSWLSPHLRFGNVSIRKIIDTASKSPKPTFLNELIWREFFMQILWHFPHTVDKSFRPQYDSIKWRNDETEFKLWCEGKTGYAMVDAGMRQLNTTGYMHNRVRLVVASFLCKHLLIDWRWGEAYFAQKLLDYEQSSNVGNWQWSAGSGVDVAPYFRIFNPMEQLKKFDKDFKYVKKWVPEFEDKKYLPIVDHKEARERVLEVFKEALSR